ncbi:MAG TPA: gliding motility lipoprotein GldJ [Flavobacteriales bacterium]|nr:gliding motility lipoprotein GldJ [Flavobacteriales bacterium]
MKKRILLSILSLAFLSLFTTSCSTQSNDFKVSRGTGRALNGKEGGYKFNPKFSKQITAPGLVFVEGGTFTFGEVQDDVMHDWNNIPNQQHVRSFYMDETEVTNLMYLEYLDWLKKVFPADDPKYRNIYKGALPDTMVWRIPLGFNDDLVNNYLRHPAYALYPVVGVNWIQAVQYCNWRTDRVNETLLYNSGKLSREALEHPTPEALFSTETYLTSPELAFGGNTDMFYRGKRKAKDSTLNVVNRSSGIILPAYRLPTEVEWEYAAKADVGIREYNTLKGRKIYPWKGTTTRNLAKGKNRGKEMANFKIDDGNYDGLAGWSDDAADITAPVKTYPPNDFGLYDMAGNVNEWVGDVYRQIIDDEVNDFNYFRGNVYTKQAFDENGKLIIITSDSIPMDTLPNGKIIASQLPGSPGKKMIDDNELYLRQNFDRADNRDYRDGDVESSRNYMKDEEEVAADPSLRMYNAPVHEVYKDSTQMIKEFDKSNKRSTLVNNEVRVIKGGSWRDRAYWLDPSQRRFYPQYLSRNDIGFRCAMSRVGNKSIKPFRRPVN